MDAALLYGGRQDNTITVRLAQVDQALRETVADACIKAWGLRGIAALEMQFAARFPKENPALDVPVAKYERVILQKKAPLGSIPKLEELTGKNKNGRVI